MDFILQSLMVVTFSYHQMNRWWSPEENDDENIIKVFAVSEAGVNLEALPNIDMEFYFNNMSIIGNKLFAYDYGVVEVSLTICLKGQENRCLVLREIILQDPQLLNYQMMNN